MHKQESCSILVPSTAFARGVALVQGTSGTYFELTILKLRKMWLRQKRARGGNYCKKLLGYLICVFPTFNTVERIFLAKFLHCATDASACL